MTPLAILLSYLLGSIPSGLWLGLKLRGIDIREHGSKNIGATNAMRVLGKGLGAVALACDAGKGVSAVLLIARLSTWPYAPLACGVAAVLGHCAPVFLKFRGGKGVATGGGVYLALCPIPTLIALGVFAVVVVLTRLVSLGSIIAAATLAVAVHVFPNHLPLRVMTVLVAAFVIWRHRTNIRRLFGGTEARI